VQERGPEILRRAAVVFAAFVGCGLMLWPIPYKQVSLPGNPSPSQLLLMGGVIAFVAAFFLRAGFAAAWFPVPAGFALAVIARVAVETWSDPTSHNLWPFEVVILGGIGAAASLAGVAFARLIQRLAPFTRSRVALLLVVCAGLSAAAANR
jgi:hypothetical protein